MPPFPRRWPGLAEPSAFSANLEVRTIHYSGMWRFCSASLLLVALCVLPASGALAQSSTGQIEMVVVDADADKPVGNVRTFLLGAQTANALTTAAGAITFTDVPIGIYRIRLQVRGYDGASTREFDVLPNRSVHVRGPAHQAARRRRQPASSGPQRPPTRSNLKVIAVVSTRKRSRSPPPTSTPIARSGACRIRSPTRSINSPGVSVTTDATDPNSPITISLNNQDESQTALTLDGIPLSAPGSAGNLRGIGTDLFSGSSVSFSPTAGGLAGGVNFSTLQPTQALQIRANGSDRDLRPLELSLRGDGLDPEPGLRHRAHGALVQQPADLPSIRRSERPDLRSRRELVHRERPRQAPLHAGRRADQHHGLGAGYQPLGMADLRPRRHRPALRHRAEQLQLRPLRARLWVGAIADRQRAKYASRDT